MLANTHHMPTGIPTMNPTVMIDNFKSMILTMSIFKGTNSSEYSFINTIMIMLLVAFIDTIVLQIKRLFSNFEAYLSNRTIHH